MTLQSMVVVHLRLGLLKALMAAAELSDYDKDRGLKRGSDGRWASKSGADTATKGLGSQADSFLPSQSGASPQGKKAVEAVTDAVLSAPTALMSTQPKSVQGAVSKASLSKTASDISDGIAGAMDKLGKGVGDAFRSAQQSVNKIVGKVGDDFKAVEKGVIGAVNNVGQFAQDHALGIAGAALLVGAAYMTKSGYADVSASGMGTLRLTVLDFGMSGVKMTLPERALLWATADKSTRAAMTGLTKFKIAQGLAVTGVSSGLADAGLTKVRRSMGDDSVRVSSAASGDDDALEALDREIAQALLEHAHDLAAEVKAELKGILIPGEKLLLLFGIDPKPIAERLKGPNVKDRQDCQLQLNELSMLFSEFVQAFSPAPDEAADQELETCVKQMNSVCKALIGGRA